MVTFCFLQAHSTLLGIRGDLKKNEIIIEVATRSPLLQWEIDYDGTSTRAASIVKEDGPGVYI